MVSVEYRSTYLVYEQRLGIRIPSDCHAFKLIYLFYNDLLMRPQDLKRYELDLHGPNARPSSLGLPQRHDKTGAAYAEL